MKKRLFVIMMHCFILQGNAQELGMCTYDAAGNRLLRSTYSQFENRGNNSQLMSERDGRIDMANERLDNHTIHVTYHSTTCTLTIEVLGMNDTDHCTAYVYNLTGQIVYNQDIVISPTEIDLSNKNNGVYILCLSLNGENRCWKIIKK